MAKENWGGGRKSEEPVSRHISNRQHLSIASRGQKTSSPWSPSKTRWRLLSKRNKSPQKRPKSSKKKSSSWTTSATTSNAKSKKSTRKSPCSKKSSTPPSP